MVHNRLDQEMRVVEKSGRISARVSIQSVKKDSKGIGNLMGGGLSLCSHVVVQLQPSTRAIGQARLTIDCFEPS